MSINYNAHKGNGEAGEKAKAMTVATLRAFLESAPDDAIVVMSLGGKSWNVSPIEQVNHTYYEDHTSRGFEGHDDHVGWLNNAPDRGARRAVCLWPMKTRGQK